MKSFLKSYWWTIALALGLLIVGFSMLEPPPPKRVVMAGGAQGGNYNAVAEIYRDKMKEKGVELVVLTTSGSVENIARLSSDGEDAADIAIAQTGFADAAADRPVQSLGSIYYEPFWVFYRDGLPIADLRDLKGLRVAMGPKGSGARALAEELIADNGLAPGDVAASDLGGAQAAEALAAGEADVAIMVASPTTAWIAALAERKDVSLLSMVRAPAYVRRHPFLSDIVLPNGVLSLGDNLPDRDVPMIAPSAEVLVREDLHPAIQSLVLEIMAQTHSGPSLLAPPGAFPKPVSGDFPMSTEATRYYERGPSVLRRLFPFNVANFLERAWVLLIPLMTLIVPIVRAAPPLYRWRIRRKIYVWYRDLRLLEMEGREADSPEERRKVRQRLAEVQAETAKVDVPDSYTDDLYRLRAHIRFVSELLDRMNAEDSAARV